GYAPSNVVEIALVGARDIALEHEFVARGEQECAPVAGIHKVVIGAQKNVAVPACGENFRIFAAILGRPFDERLLVIGRRRKIVAKGNGTFGRGGPYLESCACKHARRADQKCASVQVPLPVADLISTLAYL